MPISVKFNDAALKSIAIQASADDLKVRANRVLSAARRGCPVDQGRLRASLAVEFVTQFGQPIARIGSNLPYAIYVHEGTGVYGPKGTPIVPRNGRYLVFTPKGSKTKVFAKSVRGMRGRPFLLDALDAAK